MKTTITPDGSAPAAEIDLLTRLETANQLKVSTESCKRWEKLGYLTPIRTGPKLVRYRRSQVLALAGGRA